MEKEKVKKHEFNIKIKSKIHPSIFHTAQIDLECYERMPRENEMIETKESSPIEWCTRKKK